MRYLSQGFFKLATSSRPVIHKPKPAFSVPRAHAGLRARVRHLSQGFFTARDLVKIHVFSLYMYYHFLYTCMYVFSKLTSGQISFWCVQMLLSVHAGCMCNCLFDTTSVCVCATQPFLSFFFSFNLRMLQAETMHMHGYTDTV